MSFPSLESVLRISRDRTHILAAEAGGMDTASKVTVAMPIVAVTIFMGPPSDALAWPLSAKLYFTTSV
jgi:hypothetical protein